MKQDIYDPKKFLYLSIFKTPRLRFKACKLATMLDCHIFENPITQLEFKLEKIEQLSCFLIFVLF